MHTTTPSSHADSTLHADTLRQSALLSTSCAATTVICQQAMDTLINVGRGNPLALRDFSAINVLRVLGGKEALPVLHERFKASLELSERGEQQTRLEIIRAVAAIGHRGNEMAAVEILSELLPKNGRDYLAYNSLDGAIGYTTAEALASFGQSAEGALPKIEKLLTGSRSVEHPARPSAHERGTLSAKLGRTPSMDRQDDEIHALMAQYTQGIEIFVDHIRAGTPHISERRMDQYADSDLLQQIYTVDLGHLRDAHHYRSRDWYDAAPSANTSAGQFISALTPEQQGQIISEIANGWPNREMSVSNNGWSLISLILETSTGGIPRTAANDVAKSEYSRLINPDTERKFAA